MKKLLVLGAFALTLAGCSTPKTYNSQVTDGDTVMASVGTANITKQDLYECVMDANGVNFVLNEVLTEIASKAELDEEKINSEVTTTENTYKAMLGEDLDAYSQMYFGYPSFEEYKNEILIPSIRQNLLMNNYIEENYETLAAEYMFTKVRYIVMDDESSAVTVLSEVSSEAISFEEALEKYSTDSTNISSNGSVTLVSDLSSCKADEYIISILPQLTKIGFYSVPLELSTGKFAILEITETDQAVLKDEILSELKNADEVITTAEAHFLKENNFTILDEFFKEQMKTAYPEYVFE